MVKLANILDEKVYTFTRKGSFGRFQSSSSFPIDYLMTTFSIHEMDHLKFARDIRSEQELDFELLMQRDIDVERVRTKLTPYLIPEKSEGSSHSKSIFFPPLLAALIPTKGKLMQEYYPNQKDDESVKGYITREWPPLFKLTYLVDNGPDAYTLPVSDNKGMKDVTVLRDPVAIELRLIEGNQPGVKMVVIDGQHRLYALKELYKSNSESIKDLVVPVCILFAPYSTKVNNRKNKVPKVPEVFRSLFVDVNSTMELVGGHFNILLSDTIGSIACRKLCSELLKVKGKEGLAVIEWNIKSKKDSTEINRKYSISSIGIIDKALYDSIGNNEGLISYLLNLAEVDHLLYPGEDGNDSDQEQRINVKWEKYSLNQKVVLEKQIEKYLLPCLIEIFTTTKQFSKSFQIFNSEIRKIKSLAEGGGQDNTDAEMVLNEILEYIPIPDGKQHSAARSIRSRFENDIVNRRETEVAPIIGYAIFHRAILETFALLLRISKEYSLDPICVSKGLVKLLDAALNNNGKVLSLEKPYMQHSIFVATNLKPRESTKKALSWVIMAHLGNPSIVKSVVKALDVGSKHNKAELSKKLSEQGQNAAADFLKHYETERMKSFKATYRIDYSIDQDDRYALIEAEQRQKEDQKEVRAGTKTKKDISKDFEELVKKYVSKDIKLAGENLKISLNYETDIVGINNDDDDDA